MISTSPEITGAHASDALVFTPVFYEGRIFGYATTKSHWQDLGAKDTFPTNSTADLPGKGCAYRLSGFTRKGCSSRRSWDIVKLNSRAPDLVWGDMQAQIAGCRSAERGIAELLDRYGTDTVRGCIEEMYRYSRTMIEEAIERMPDGVYKAEDCLDDNGVDLEKRVLVKIAVTIEGEKPRWIYRFGPEQKGPMNGLLISTIAASRAASKGPHGA